MEPRSRSSMVRWRLLPRLTALQSRMEGLTSKGVVALKPENVILPQRTRVTIQDVISRPQLNGRAGSIRDVEGDRYVVDLPGEAPLKVRFHAAVAC